MPGECVNGELASSPNRVTYKHSEVEWSLGYALSRHAEQRRLETRSERAADANATQDECRDVEMDSSRS